MTTSSSTTNAQRFNVNNSPGTSQVRAMPDAIAKAGHAIESGDIPRAVRGLAEGTGGDRRAFHDAVLDLLDGSSCRNGQALMEEVRRQQPHFDFNGFGKTGRTALDIAVRHDDPEFARYLLGQGANPGQKELGAGSDRMRSLLVTWNRKTELYADFNEGNRKGGTPLDRLLHEGSFGEARERLQGMLDKHGAKKVWEEAIKVGQHDILRALLILGTKDELDQIAGQKQSLGKWQEALHEHPRLAAALKKLVGQQPARSHLERFRHAFLRGEGSGRTEEAGSSSLNANQRPVSDEKIKRYVRSAYKALRYYHGTNKSGVESIRANGMSTRLKTAGSVGSALNTAAQDPDVVQRSREHNYVASIKAPSTTYAWAASVTNMRDWTRREGDDGVPRMARLFKTSDLPGLEKDPDFPIPVSFLNPLYRTREDIPAHAVRGQRGANRYSEEILTAMQKHIEDKYKVSLSHQDIERALLDDVESDSDDDFR